MSWSLKIILVIKKLETYWRIYKSRPMQQSILKYPNNLAADYILFQI